MGWYDKGEEQYDPIELDGWFWAFLFVGLGAIGFTMLVLLVVLR